MATRYARVELELGLATEPISGIFRADGEHSHPFTGWLELAALLDRARAIRGYPLPFEEATG